MIKNENKSSMNRNKDNDLLTNYSKKLDLLQEDLGKLIAIKEKLEERLLKSENKDDSNEII